MVADSNNIKYYCKQCLLANAWQEKDKMFYPSHPSHVRESSTCAEFLTKESDMVGITIEEDIEKKL